MSILRPLIKRKKSQREEPIDTPYTTGLIQDPPDDRDYQLSNIKEVSGVKNAPQKVDYSPEMSPIKNQMNLGACVGFAVAAVREGQEKMEYLKEKKKGSDYKRETKEYDLSEAGIYWNCKKIDDFPGSEGTSIRAGMKVLNRIGVPQEKAGPYTDDKENPGKPKPGSKLTARWKKIKSYHRINNIDELIDYIANHGPVIAGVLVYRGFYYPENDGTVPMPGSNERPLGAHAIPLCGYDKNTEKIMFKNSGGPNGGNNGFGMIHFKFWENHSLDTGAATDIDVKKETLEGKWEGVKK